MPKAIDWATLPDNALVRQRDLLSILPFSPATLWRRVKDGSFPRPIKINPAITAWQWGKVRTWLQVQGGHTP